MGMATAFNFQAAGSGNVAATGDFVMTGDEVNPIATRAPAERNRRSRSAQSHDPRHAGAVLHALLGGRHAREGCIRTSRRGRFVEEIGSAPRAGQLIRSAIIVASSNGSALPRNSAICCSMCRSTSGICSPRSARRASPRAARRRTSRRGVLRLDQAVGVEEEEIAGLQPRLGFGVAVAGIQGDRHAGRAERLEPARRAPRTADCGPRSRSAAGDRRVSRIARKSVEVDAAGRVLIELAIEPIGERGEIGLVRQPRAQRRLDVRHQQRRADALARDVADEQREAAVRAARSS